MQNTPLPKLTTSQFYILKLTYKFRFLTSHHLANIKNHKDHVTAYRLLEKLTTNGYLIKRYNNTYKIAGKNAVYSLAKPAVKLLRDSREFCEPVLNAMYKNATVTEGSIEQHLEILKIYNVLKAHYIDTFDIFTKNELFDQDYFPDPRPDLYLRRHDVTHKPNEFMLFVVNDIQLFVIKKKLKPWLTHYDEAGWDGDYPTILLVCVTSSVESRLRTYLTDLGLDDELHILMTTKRAVIAGLGSELWTDYRSDMVLMNLN